MKYLINKDRFGILYECDDNELENFLNNPCKSVGYGTWTIINFNNHYYRSNYFPKNNVKFITVDSNEINELFYNKDK